VPAELSRQGDVLIPKRKVPVGPTPRRDVAQCAAETSAHGAGQDIADTGSGDAVKPVAGLSAQVGERHHPNLDCKLDIQVA